MISRLGRMAGDTVFPGADGVDMPACGREVEANLPEFPAPGRERAAGCARSSTPRRPGDGQTGRRPATRGLWHSWTADTDTEEEAVEQGSYAPGAGVSRRGGAGRSGASSAHSTSVRPWRAGRSKVNNEVFLVRVDD